MLAVTILGNNSALPAHNRHPTAQIVQSDKEIFLVDCGEGTQMQMARYKIKSNRLNNIFISHLHGDHYFGLIGLLTSMGLGGRKKELNLFAPAILKDIIEIQLKAADSTLSYSLNFYSLESENIIMEDKNISIECFKVYHRIECWGFIFREKNKNRHILPEEIKKYSIPVSMFESLQKGNDFITLENKVIKNEHLTSASDAAKAYAYCADTIYNDLLIEKIRNVDLLYHETTYLENLKEKATSRFHSTAKDAATIAQKAQVKKLLIGHFSSIYETLDDFKTEASEIFIDVELALEGCTYLA